MPDVVERASVAVTQHGAVAAGEYAGHPVAVKRQDAVAHRVHTTMDRMQAPDFDPAVNRRGAQPERDQLAMCHRTVLARRELRNRPVTWAILISDSELE